MTRNRTTRTVDTRLDAAAQEIDFLKRDVRVLMSERWWRWFTCWLRVQFWAVASYRVERAAFLALGRAWPVWRVVLSPVIAIIRPNTIDISYEAAIGPGLVISHPALGVVISRHAIIGERAVLTGGNCVGIRREFGPGDELTIGDDLNLGANAVVLGPVRIGDRVRIGAGAVATRDARNDSVVRSGPAEVRPP